MKNSQWLMKFPAHCRRPAETMENFMSCRINVATNGAASMAAVRIQLVLRLWIAGLLFLLVAPMAFPAAAPAGKWLHYRPVVYQENHDPSMVFLKGGIEFEVRYGKVSLGEVETWKPGRKLAFAYRSDTGPVLVDIATGHLLPVVSGWKEHPLDEYLTLQTQAALKGSTVTIVQSEETAAELWKKEMTRTYEDLKVRLAPRQRKLLEQAQQQWQRFKEMEVQLLQSLDDDAGTIGPAIYGQRVSVLYRNRALELLQR